MSEERETPAAGAPVEENQATSTEVLAAVERASEVTPPATALDEATVTPAAAGVAVPTPANVARVATPVSDDTVDRPIIAPVLEQPSAAPGPSASEIFAAATPAQPEGASPLPTPSPQGAVLAERLQADAAAEPLVAATAVAASPKLGPVRDGEIRISPDHPMAALYMQTPMPPELKGNRGAGVLIGLLATLGFALVYAGVLALWIAPLFPPSTFLSEGLLPILMSWGFILAVAGFFIALTVLVLIAGRAGWWAYVLGGLIVAVLVWGATLGGVAIDARLAGESVGFDPIALVADFGLVIPVLAAALVAREVTVWFGAWIGARGRKVTRKNAAALAEYEEALNEAQAPKL